MIAQRFIKRKKIIFLRRVYMNKIYAINLPKCLPIMVIRHIIKLVGSISKHEVERIIICGCCWLLWRGTSGIVLWK